MRCPHCQRDTVREATPDELKVLAPLLQEWMICEADRVGERSILWVVCPECGWFEYALDLHAMTIRRTMKQILRRIKGQQQIWERPAK